MHAEIGRRVDAIARELAHGDFDLIALQEAWRDKDSRQLWKSSGLSDYARYLRDVALGTGLATLSRFPIIEKQQLRFTCRPSALRLYQGESVANKGVLMTKVKTPQGELDVYNTHLISDYPDTPYRTLRLTQIFDLTEMVRELSAERPFVILGDLNTGPGDSEYEIMRDLLGLQDVCRKKKEELCRDPDRSSRIDHILLPAGRLKSSPLPVFTEPIAGTTPPLRYSDHRGISASLGWELLALRQKPEARYRLQALEDIEAAIDKMLETMARRRRARSWIPIYGFFMAARYDLQLRQLTSVRERVSSQRLQLR